MRWYSFTDGSCLWSILQVFIDGFISMYIFLRVLSEVDTLARSSLMNFSFWLFGMFSRVLMRFPMGLFTAIARLIILMIYESSFLFLNFFRKVICLSMMILFAFGSPVSMCTRSLHVDCLTANKFLRVLL